MCLMCSVLRGKWYSLSFSNNCLMEERNQQFIFHLNTWEPRLQMGLRWHISIKVIPICQRETPTGGTAHSSNSHWQLIAPGGSKYLSK